ncbi:hypothetical protein ANN_14123 [Periplaneta americana]|uniref:Uncharacterized protein n=1 Tax=Periplaneta americana TaxID=6978 RepID=A0ABQ8SWH0_PERAM|nr:hypothetical protein ANN_14123 [Periplaneta americana]
MQSFRVVVMLTGTRDHVIYRRWITSYGVMLNNGFILRSQKQLMTLGTISHCVNEIGGSEIFGEMRPRIRHRLPDIRLIVGENLGKHLTREVTRLPGILIIQACRRLRSTIWLFYKTRSCHAGTGRARTSRGEGNARVPEQGVRTGNTAPSLMLACNEFQSLGRAIVKEAVYEEVRWDGIVSIVSWRERVFRCGGKKEPFYFKNLDSPFSINLQEYTNREHNRGALKYTTEYEEMASLLCFHGYQFKACRGSLYVVMWLADEPREFNLPTLPQRRITYVPEKLPSKYGVHSEEYVPIRTVESAIETVTTTVLVALITVADVVIVTMDVVTTVVMVDVLIVIMMVDVRLKHEGVRVEDRDFFLITRCNKHNRPSTAERTSANIELRHTRQSEPNIVSVMDNDYV